LLIEPQLNPVKHVPWVTVSHKILAPMWIAMDLHGLLAQRMNAAMADVMTFLIVTLTPGIFGYLVWELKENWRLFAANRSQTLDAVLVGSHGETLPRLLRPGLHSGTIPKRFARLRRAERKVAAADGDPRAVRKHREMLHHIETDLRRYIEREFTAWFSESRSWQLPRPAAEEIRLATGAIIVRVMLPGAVEGPLLLVFELANGSLQLDLSGRICGEGLSAAAWHVLRTAIVNLLKTGGVDVLYRTSSAAIPAVDAANRQEIGLLYVTWSDWIAAWESDSGMRDDAAWERIPLL